MEKGCRSLHNELLGQGTSDLEDFFDSEIEKQEHYHVTNDSGTENIIQGEMDIKIEEDGCFYVFEVKTFHGRLEKAIKQLRRSERYLKAECKPVEKYVIIEDKNNPGLEDEMIYLLE